MCYPYAAASKESDLILCSRSHALASAAVYVSFLNRYAWIVMESDPLSLPRITSIPGAISFRRNDPVSNAEGCRIRAACSFV